MKFNELDLVPEVKDAVSQLGFDSCTPIQAAVMPHIIAGKDISGLAQTGTGKTGAFLIPLIHRWLKSEAFFNKEHSAGDEIPADVFNDFKKHQFCLVLVPTRELADQVFESFQKLKGKSSLKGVCVYGGVDIEQQKRKMKDGFDFLIATPGRLIDLYKSHALDLKQVRAIVFDEADRMFDMGFKDDMKYLLQRMPQDRQFLVFSATLNFDVLTVAYQFGANPIEVHIDRDNITAENVNHSIFHLGGNEKPKYLLSILKRENAKQTIIFSNFRHNIEKLVNFLNLNGIPAMGISSLLTQPQRNRVMEQFKGENTKNILVATDVAARGLDVKGVDLVINYELPDDAENYVHRIGRTGRAGEKGVAYSLVSDLDLPSLTRIETYLKEKLETGWLEDSDLLEDFVPFPSVQRRDSGRNDRRHKTSGSKRPRRSDGQQRRDRSDFKRDKNRDKDRDHKHKDRDRDGKQRSQKFQDRKRSDKKHTGKTHKRHDKRPQKSGYKPRVEVKKKESKVSSLLKKLAFWK